jgi:magnesium transporter
MLYLSQLLGASLEDNRQGRIGKLIDILVPAAQVGQQEAAYPSALLIEGPDNQLGPRRVAPSAVKWREETLYAQIPDTQLAGQEGSVALPGEISLAHEVLDRQVIDFERKKTVRVNDICFGDDWQLLGVDNSTPGLMRRLAPAWLFGSRSKNMPANLIPWSDIELIDAQRFEDTPVATDTLPAITRTQSGHLAELHPADIAEIIHQLTPEQGARLIEGLDDEDAADAMEEIDTELQRDILENIPAERAADILQTMGPDEAADLIARLPEELAQQLLSLMTPAESEDVQDLLEYEANSAGGLMTTDYIAINQDKSAAQALEAVRLNLREQDIRPAYVYCVPDETQDECALVGIVSLWDLLIAPTDQPLREIMETDIISVQPDADPHSVAQTMAKYNLLAIPVLGENGILEGIITVDDALDILLPPDRRRKPTRMY